MMIMNKNKAVLTAAFILQLFFAPGLSAAEENMDDWGEQMTFEVRWSFVVAGIATLEFFPEEELNGTSVNYYVYKARTSKFVDLFYKVRDIIESFTDPDLNRSIIYRKTQRGKSEKDIADFLDVDTTTIWRVKKRYLEEGVESAIREKPRSGQPVKYNQDHKTELTAIACSEAPEGREKWTIELLTEKMRSDVDGCKDISKETVRLYLPVKPAEEFHVENFPYL